MEIKIFKIRHFTEELKGQKNDLKRGISKNKIHYYKTIQFLEKNHSLSDISLNKSAASRPINFSTISRP